jgi:hypothetical protein
MVEFADVDHEPRDPDIESNMLLIEFLKKQDGEVLRAVAEPCRSRWWSTASRVRSEPATSTGTAG